MILTTAAEVDLLEARDWYERQRDGLGLRFARAVDASMDRIERAPLRFPSLIDAARRAPVSGFPYGIWYIVGGDTLVIGVLHHRRDILKLVSDRGR